MKTVLINITLLTLIVFSANSQALVSHCAPGPWPDGFYHRASLDALEITYPYVRTWMETRVNGPVAPSLFTMFYNTWNSWHFFINMPPGTYQWSGLASSEVDASDFYLGVIDISLCAGAVTIEAPPFCETTGVQVNGSTNLTSNIHGYVVTAIKGGFEAVEKLGICSTTGTPTFSGSLMLEDVGQCCEDSDTHATATRASGTATFSVPSLSCSLKQIIVPAYGIVLEGSVVASASASFSYSGMDSGMCESQADDITLRGAIGGGFGGEIGVGGLSTQIIGAGVRLSDTFSLAAQGPDVLTLEVSGCIGPAEISGWVRFLGNEVRTEIVPQEWAEGTQLCF